jgi:hypothetical protein
VIQLDWSREWHHKGVPKGFSYAIDQRPPFVLTENLPTLWAVLPTLVYFHLVFLSLLEPGSDAATLACPLRAPVCCREGLCQGILDDTRRAKSATSSVYLGASFWSIHREPVITGGSGTDKLAANVVEDMADDRHALRQTCSERGHLRMDVSEPSGA